MKRILPISFLMALALTNTVRAQSFTGHVKDLSTGDPIPFSSIYFVELETGTTADGNGRFTIEHSPTKKIHIQISSVGYVTLGELLDLGVVNNREFFLEKSHVDLKEVVVSTPAGKLTGENVVSIERKKLDDLQRSNPTSLAEAITEIPGVEQNSTGTGIGKPVIRGLSGNRIVTYAQGIRIENQQWGEEHGLGVGEVGIESVEVIKGPASLLYGSDALGGVLYFVGERYAKHNTVEGFVRTTASSNTLGNTNNLGLKLHYGRFKTNLFGTYASNADYQVPGKERVFNTRFDEKNIKTAVGYDRKNWISHIRYSYLQNDFGIPADTLASTSERKPVMPYQTIDNHNLSWENTVFLHEARLNLTGGYTGNRRREYEDLTSAPALDMALGSYTYNAKWYSPKYLKRLNVIAGSQGMYQNNLNKGQEILIPDGTTADMGLFSILNYSTKQLNIQSGVRADRRNIRTVEMINLHDTIPSLNADFTSLNYAAGAVYKLKHMRIRGNLSSGFRAPNTPELLSFGVHEGANRFEIGNRNLKNENAVQVDLALDYRSEHLSFSVNPFYNAIAGFIYLTPVDMIMEGVPAYQYAQTSALLYGGEAGIHYHPHGIDWLHLESNLSAVMAEDANGMPLPLIPASKLSSTAKIEFSKKNKRRLRECYVQHIYRMRQNRVASLETATGAYHLLNMGLSLDLGGKKHPVELSAGVRNLLNATYIDHLSRLKAFGIPNQGINFYAALRVSFEKNISGPAEE